MVVVVLARQRWCLVLSRYRTLARNHDARHSNLPNVRTSSSVYCNFRVLHAASQQSIEGLFPSHVTRAASVTADLVDDIEVGQFDDLICKRIVENIE